MKKLLILLILMLSQVAFAQVATSQYEAEIFKNPNKNGKDTREVNAVLAFEKDNLKVTSRRKKEIFKDFKYSDIKYVEHSFSKTPLVTAATKALILAVFTGLPLFYSENEKHWLTIVTDDDFVVLKIENDNYRLLKMEFLVRKFDVININENRQ
jgi:hypothetical protein